MLTDDHICAKLWSQRSCSTPSPGHNLLRSTHASTYHQDRSMRPRQQSLNKHLKKLNYTTVTDVSASVGADLRERQGHGIRRRIPRRRHCPGGRRHHKTRRLQRRVVGSGRRYRRDTGHEGDCRRGLGKGADRRPARFPGAARPHCLQLLIGRRKLACDLHYLAVPHRQDRT